MTIRICFLFVACFLFQSGNLFGKVDQLDPHTVSRFEERIYRITTRGRLQGKTISYRLFSPKKIDPKKKYPLILWLHGKGEGGNDNMSQLAFLRHEMLENQKEPFFILAPQMLSSGRGWTGNFAAEGEPAENMLQIVISLTESAIYNNSVDPERVSIFGYKNGGWAAQVAAAQRPDLFAAVASCDSKIITDEELLDNLSSTPAWFFHNLNDKEIYIREMQSDLKKLNNYARLTVYPSLKRPSWIDALVKDDVFNWLVSQRKGHKPSWKSEPFKTLWLLKEAGVRFSTLAVSVVLCVFLWRSYRPKKNPA